MPIYDLAVAELGYGESKLVAELILEKAGQICGTHSTVLRIGHIAGPIEKDGFWNRNEWIPTVGRPQSLDFNRDKTHSNIRQSLPRSIWE
jgi:nucleoside-diphosphate-sugar epimerase